MSHVANKHGILARQAMPDVVVLRHQGAQQRERPLLLQPLWTQALRAVCGIKLRANGIPIRVVTFLAFQPAKPCAWSCRTYSEVP